MGVHHGGTQGWDWFLPYTQKKVVILSSPAPVLVAEPIDQLYVVGVHHGNSTKIGL